MRVNTGYETYSPVGLGIYRKVSDGYVAREAWFNGKKGRLVAAYTEQEEAKNLAAQIRSKGIKARVVCKPRTITENAGKWNERRVTEWVYAVYRLAE